MSNAMPIQITTDELIERLEARRAWARKLDAKALATHQRAERAAEKRFKDKCRAALKADYATLKADSENYRSGRDLSTIDFDPPGCPVGIEPQIDEVLTSIRLSNQAKWTIDPDGRGKQVHWLLTHDEKRAESLC